MTAKLQAEEIVRLKQMGVLGVISKPFDPMTLAQSVRMLWNAGQQATSDGKAPAVASVSDLSTALSGIRDQYVGTLPRQDP